MILEPVTPTPDEMAKILCIHGLFPDEWVKEPLALVAKMQGSFFWAIRIGRKVIGLVWLSDIIPDSSASIHILVNKPYRKYCRPRRVKRKWNYKWHAPGKLAAYNGLLAYAFNELGVRRLTTSIPVSRRAAFRLARRLGFSREGELRHAVSINGKIDNLAIWGMTREDYENWKETHHGLGNAGSGTREPRLGSVSNVLRRTTSAATSAAP